MPPTLQAWRSVPKVASLWLQRGRLLVSHWIVFCDLWHLAVSLGSHHHHPGVAAENPGPW